jgi:plasmid stability protein
MAVITVRNLPEEAARALKARAARSVRSTEAEVREILNASVRPPMAIGSALVSMGKRAGGVDLSRRRKRRPDAAVIRWLDLQSPVTLYVTTISQGELWPACRHCPREDGAPSCAR